MVDPRRAESVCPACEAPAPASSLCRECSYAVAAARAVHPSATPRGAPSVNRRPVDDMDLWDAWALLGDPGDQRNRVALE
jgi:hypothetical protein